MVAVFRGAGTHSLLCFECVDGGGMVQGVSRSESERRAEFEIVAPRCGRRGYKEGACSAPASTGLRAAKRGGCNPPVWLRPGGSSTLETAMMNVAVAFSTCCDTTVQSTPRTALRHWLHSSQLRPHLLDDRPSLCRREKESMGICAGVTCTPDRPLRWELHISGCQR
jgi:hypothetical protein